MKTVIINLKELYLKNQSIWKFKKKFINETFLADLIYFEGDKIPERFFSIVIKNISRKIIIIDSIYFLKLTKNNPFFLMINKDFNISYLKLKNLVNNQNCQEIFIDYSDTRIKEIYFNKPICPILSNIYKQRNEYSYRHINNVKKLYENQKKLANNIINIDKNVNHLNRVISKNPFLMENILTNGNKNNQVIMGMMGDIIWNKTYKYTIKYNLKNISNKLCRKCIYQEVCSDMLLGLFIKNEQCVNFSKKFY